MVQIILMYLFTFIFLITTVSRKFANTFTRNRHKKLVLRQGEYQMPNLPLSMPHVIKTLSGLLVVFHKLDAMVSMYLYCTGTHGVNVLICEELFLKIFFI